MREEYVQSLTVERLDNGYVVSADIREGTPRRAGKAAEHKRLIFPDEGSLLEFLTDWFGPTETSSVV